MVVRCVRPRRRPPPRHDATLGTDDSDFETTSPSRHTNATNVPGGSRSSQHADISGNRFRITAQEASKLLAVT
eukprot:gene1740-biopygen4003